MNTELEKLIGVVRGYFNALDEEIANHDKDPNKSKEYAQERATFEKQLRLTILTEKDKFLMRRVDGMPKEYIGNILELTKECDTTTAREYITRRCLEAAESTETKAS